jgi:hypothetical protein
MTDPTAALRTALARQVRDDKGWVFLSQATMRLIDEALASQADDPAPQRTAFAYAHPFPCPLNNPSASVGDVCSCSQADDPSPTATLRTATRMPSFAAIRKAITDSYYDTRNEGGTMETAADLAATRVLSLASQADDPSDLPADPPSRSQWGVAALAEIGRLREVISRLDDGRGRT